MFRRVCVCVCILIVFNVADGAFAGIAFPSGFYCDVCITVCRVRDLPFLFSRVGICEPRN